MKVFVVIASLLAIAMAEDMMAAESYPVSTLAAGPAVAASSVGSAYGAHGARNAGLNAYGRSNYGDQGLYRDRASAAQGYQNIGAARSLDASGAQASNYGRYRNVGAYARDRGAGYEKAYNYDRAAGNRAITADYGANSASSGIRDRAASQNIGAYGRSGHDRLAARNAYGGNAYGVNAHNQGAYGVYGAGQAQSIRAAPAVVAAAPVGLRHY